MQAEQFLRLNSTPQFNAFAYKIAHKLLRSMTVDPGLGVLSTTDNDGRVVHHELQGELQRGLQGLSRHSPLEMVQQATFDGKPILLHLEAFSPLQFTPVQDIDYLNAFTGQLNDDEMNDSLGADPRWRVTLARRPNLFHEKALVIFNEETLWEAITRVKSKKGLFAIGIKKLWLVDGDGLLHNFECDTLGLQWAEKECLAKGGKILHEKIKERTSWFYVDDNKYVLNWRSVVPPAKQSLPSKGVDGKLDLGMEGGSTTKPRHKPKPLSFEDGLALQNKLKEHFRINGLTHYIYDCATQNEEGCLEYCGFGSEVEAKYFAEIVERHPDVARAKHDLISENGSFEEPSIIVVLVFPR